MAEFHKRGEWDNEPDREEFVHAELPCLILRGPLGSLCGYVGVPPAHPHFGPKMKTLELLDNREVDARYEDVDVHVHGGLTYCGEGEGEIRREGFYWFGFDCAHLGDYIPPMVRAGFSDYESPGVYCNWAYVKREVQHLAEQLAAMMPMPSHSDWLREQAVRRG